jgi:hypothetical protein
MSAYGSAGGTIALWIAGKRICIAGEIVAAPRETLSALRAVKMRTVMLEAI